ncbi:MAG TPA: hypothetical protein VFS64_08990 [Solirubrobacterales bacterium]|nr:hypothetical protein [Solirubrobacterales bacterium]
MLLALAAACALPSAAAGAEPLRMTNLEVEGGEANWHPGNVFRLTWQQAPAPPPSARAVLYRLYDPEGTLIDGPVRSTKASVIGALRVPSTPGAYTVEAWLEDAAGQMGPPAYATLRFDDAAPRPPAPVALESWLTGRDGAPLEIGHPPGPLPVSGIRGYAISIDEGSGGTPCADPSLCTLAETDLAGGIGDDRIDLGPLPEGTTYARVVAVSGSGVASPVASVPLRVDGTSPQPSLQGVPNGWSSGPVHVSAVASDPLSGMAAAGPDGPFTAIAVDGGAPALASGDTVSTWVAGSGVHRVACFARDAAGNVSDPALAATIRIDEASPRVSFAIRQDPAEPERIEATVADPLSGPSDERGTIQLRPAGSHGRFEELATRVVGDRLVAHWDSDSYPPGSYEFLATGYDRAGNAASSGKRASGGAMVLANPLKQPVGLEDGFGGRELVWQRCRRTRDGRRCHRRRVTGFDARPAARTVPFGRGVRFGGRLLGADGNGLGGLGVAVTETFAAGALPQQRTTLVRTAADGTFVLSLAPGPSRDVTASFAGSRTLTRARTRSVHLGVLAAIRLGVSATTAKVGGAPIVFSGDVGTSGIAGPKQGLPVELQFRYPGAEWSEFRTVEADARGRFRYAYRFSDDDSRGVRFQFRACVNGREGWPYEPACSRPVTVTGR